MDESDPLITFDEGDICTRCQDWERRWAAHLQFLRRYPEPLLSEVKARGRGREFDVVLGMSGGADSSWVYHLAKSAGLRVLPIHFDNGYDLPVSVHNVRCLTEKWGDEVEVVKVNGSTFREMQLAFLKSGTTGLEIPTDHAIKAATYQLARRRGINVVLNGANVATESHGTPAWTQGHADWKYIRCVSEKFGASTYGFPHYSKLDQRTWMSRIWWLSLLDYTNYHRQSAIDEMGRIYGYEDYGFKHMESRITRFLHGYIIPRRFDWDTRRSRLSSMIRSGQMTRENALHMLSQPAYSVDEMELDRMYLCKALRITSEEFEALMRLPIRNFWDYPSYAKDSRDDPLLRLARRLYRSVAR